MFISFLVAFVLDLLIYFFAGSRIEGPEDHSSEKTLMPLSSSY